MLSAERWVGCDGTRLSAQHREALLKRGLTAETIEAAGLWSASAEQVAELLGFNPCSAGVVIPYMHPLTGEVALNRVRPDNPPILNGKPAKYLSPKGAENRLYFPPNSAELLRSTAPLIITEGEFKVLLAYQSSLSCIGLTGVYGFRGRNAQGEKGPIPDLDLLTWEGRVVSIVYDSDAATNERVRKAREALAWELYRRGVQVAYSIDLPALNGEKTGLDDFLVAQGVEAFYDLDVDEIPSPCPRVKLWSGIDLRAAVMERPPAIVKAWGIRRGGKVILVGLGGRGKSTLLSQLTCHFASRVPLLGHGALEVAGPQRVLIYMAEDPLSEVKFRWERQMEALGCGDDVAERIAFLDPQGARITLTDEHGRTTLFDALRRHQATVAILDPLVSLHDQEENSNSAMRKVLDLLNPFQVETGCTFIIAHHEPKAPDSNGAAARGAAAIRDWCRTMLRLTAQGAGDNGTTRFKLDLDKANYGGTVWSLLLERQQDSYLFTAVNVEASVTPRDVWAVAGPEGGWVEDVKQKIVERFGVSEPTARRAIEKAEELKVAIVAERKNPQTGRDKKYLVRGAGEQIEERE